MIVDLHIHTYYSDGTMSVAEVVEEAKNKGVEVIAITDHNRVEAFEELASLAKEAGGVSVLAHPGEYFKDLSILSHAGDKEKSLATNELLEELEHMKKLGLQGIECYYPTHSKLLEETCEAFCIKYDLVRTAGSDEHGAFGKEAQVINQTIGCLGKDIEDFKLQKLVLTNEE